MSNFDPNNPAHVAHFGTHGNVREKIAAVEKAATEMDISRREMFAILRPTLKLSASDVLTFEAHLHSTPEPLTPAQAKTQAEVQAKAVTDRAAAEQRAQVKAINKRAAHRELRERNPFAAARVGLQDPSLYDPDPEPEAA